MGAVRYVTHIFFSLCLFEWPMISNLGLLAKDRLYSSEVKFEKPIQTKNYFQDGLPVIFK